MNPPGSKPALVLNADGLAGHAGLASELLAADIHVVFRRIDQLAMAIGPDRVRVWETVDGQDLEGFGLVQVAAYPWPTATLVNAVADYLRVKGVPAINLSGIGAPTKLFKYMRLAHQGVAIPTTLYLPPPLLADSYEEVVAQLDLPFVIKTVAGAGGRLTSLVSTRSQLAEHLIDGKIVRAGFLAQEFVPPDGSCFLLVLGGHVALALQYRDVGSVLVPSDWERVIPLDAGELDPAARETAVRAAESLAYDIAGVHLVKHWTTGQWCVLDVDPNPSIGSGDHATDKVTAYLAYLRKRLAQPARDDEDVTWLRSLRTTGPADGLESLA